MIWGCLKTVSIPSLLLSRWWWIMINHWVFSCFFNFVSIKFMDAHHVPHEISICGADIDLQFLDRPIHCETTMKHRAVGHPPSACLTWLWKPWPIQFDDLCLFKYWEFWFSIATLDYQKFCNTASAMFRKMIAIDQIWRRPMLVLFPDKTLFVCNPSTTFLKIYLTSFRQVNIKSLLLTAVLLVLCISGRGTCSTGRTPMWTLNKQWSPCNPVLAQG